MYILTTTSTQTRIWDGTGLLLSLTCVAHCLVTPLLAVAIPVLVATEEQTHQGFALAILLVGSVAFLLGFRKHQKADPLLIGSLGIVVIGTAAFFSENLAIDGIGGISTEVALTLAGGTCLVIAHVRNLLLCRLCPVCLDTNQSRCEA